MSEKKTTYYVIEYCEMAEGPYKQYKKHGHLNVEVYVSMREAAIAANVIGPEKKWHSWRTNELQISSEK